MSYRPSFCYSALLLLLVGGRTVGFSAGGKSFGNPSSDGDDTSFALFDRFRAECPAKLDCIRQYESSLIDEVGNYERDDVWVAVYRTSNNKPSVLIKDEFFQAMKSATDTVNPPSSAADPALTERFVQSKTVPPIAVARLRPSDKDDKETAKTFVLDTMRCILKKEHTDASCDGGSEHTEALCTAIDAVIHHYLHSTMNEKNQNKQPCFEGAIRTKATLVSAPLLEERGFRPVQELQTDMATHVSSLDDCLQQYAARSVSTDSSKSPGARMRAMDIVSVLGRIDRAADFLHAQQRIDNDERNRDDEYDPWSSFQQFL